MKRAASKQVAFSDEDDITPATKKMVKFYNEENVTKTKSKRLKISSWNVNGLRACVNKDACTEYILSENPDIMALQQIRCQEEEVPESFKKTLSHYYMYWIGSDKGQGGVGLLTKEKPLSVSYGMPNFATAEGRLITAKFEKFVFITAYVPNSGIKLKTIDYRISWDQYFHDYVRSTLYKNSNVIISGDLNVCLQPIDLAHPDKNQKTAGFTVEERRNFQELLDIGFEDAFRYLYPKQEGAYTYWIFRNKTARENNKGWRLDYHLISENLATTVKDCIIRSDVTGSTHCPVTLLISV